MSSAQQIEAQIRAERGARFASLNLPAEFIAPNYGGRSIVNIPASIVRLFGGQMHTAPLDPAILDGVSGGLSLSEGGGALARRVVLVIADALGYQRMVDALDDNPQNGFHALLRNGGQLTPLTSVFPSTTTAALTALWSGYTPAEHGLMGYTQFLRASSVRADMITFNPLATNRQGGEQLVAAGLQPEQFLPVPSLPQTLAQIEVPVYNLIEQPFVKSALSRLQIRGQRETRGFVTSSDMWTALRAWLEQRTAERALFVAYWSAVDTIAHLFGPSVDGLLAEVNNLAYSFEREFLNRLSPAARADTLFLLTADHGQMDTPLKSTVYLRDHPQLAARLLMAPTGDPRAAYLYCCNGETAAARAYIEERLPDRFVVLDSQTALSAGLFGAGQPAPETRYRIGDLILLARGPHRLWERNDPPKMLGLHGSLTPEEMLVPLLAARLD